MTACGIVRFRHLKRVHDDSYNKYQKSVEQQTSVREAGQSSLESFCVKSDNVHYGSASVRQKSLIQSLVSNLIVQCALPISVVDHPAFRAFLSDMDPKFAPPARQTVTNSILPQLLISEQSKVSAVLNRSSDISLTLDIWTDRRMHSFLGVTAHLLIAGVPDSRLIAFRSFSGSHTGQHIADALEGIVVQHELQSKIRFCVTDNASNMRKALTLILDINDVLISLDGSVDDPTLWDDDIDNEDLGGLTREWQHIPCFAHSLQLVVRDGLACLGVARSLLAK